MVMSVYEDVRLLISSRESVMSASAPASVPYFYTGPQPTATVILHAHEYGHRGITGRMCSRYLVVPVGPKERSLSYKGNAPPM